VILWQHYFVLTCIYHYIYHYICLFVGSHATGGAGTRRGKKAVPSFTEEDFPRLGKPAAKAQSDSESESEDDDDDDDGNARAAAAAEFSEHQEVVVNNCSVLHLSVKYCTICYGNLQILANFAYS
jgi:hypothetical protein